MSWYNTHETCFSRPVKYHIYTLQESNAWRRWLENHEGRLISCWSTSDLSSSLNGSCTFEYLFLVWILTQSIVSIIIGHNHWTCPPSFNASFQILHEPSTLFGYSKSTPFPITTFEQFTRIASSQITGQQPTHSSLSTINEFFSWPKSSTTKLWLRMRVRIQFVDFCRFFFLTAYPKSCVCFVSHTPKKRKGVWDVPVGWMILWKIAPMLIHLSKKIATHPDIAHPIGNPPN